jgi:hypothetical protein
MSDQRDGVRRDARTPRRVGVVLGALAVAALLLGAGCSSKSGAKPASSPSVVIDPSAPSDIGKPIQDGVIEYNVEQVYYMDSTPDRDGKAINSAKGTLCVLSVLMKGLKGDPMFRQGDQVGYDAAGHAYAPIALLIPDQVVNEGAQFRNSVIFDIPKDVKVIQVALRAVDGTGKVVSTPATIHIK